MPPPRTGTAYTKHGAVVISIRLNGHTRWAHRAPAGMNLNEARSLALELQRAYGAGEWSPKKDGMPLVGDGPKSAPVQTRPAQLAVRLSANLVAILDAEAARLNATFSVGRTLGRSDALRAILTAYRPPGISRAALQFARDRGAQPNAPNRLDAKVIEQIRTLAADGAGAREIARTLSISRSTVTAYVGPGDHGAGMRRHHERRKADGKPILPPWRREKTKK